MDGLGSVLSLSSVDPNILQLAFVHTVVRCLVFFVLVFLVFDNTLSAYSRRITKAPRSLRTRISKYGFYLFWNHAEKVQCFTLKLHHSGSRSTDLVFQFVPLEEMTSFHQGEGCVRDVSRTRSDRVCSYGLFVYAPEKPRPFLRFESLPAADRTWG